MYGIGSVPFRRFTANAIGKSNHWIEGCSWQSRIPRMPKTDIRIEGDSIMPDDWGQEIDSLEGWVAKNPNSIVFAHLADCYLQTEEVDRAIQICEQGLQKYPEYPSAYYVLAKCFLAKRQYEEAEKRLKKVLMLDPKFLKAHRCYGDLMQEIGWEKSSEMSYKRVLEIDPLDEETRTEMDSLRNQEMEKADELVDEAALTEAETELEDAEAFTRESLPTESFPVEEAMPEQMEEVEEELGELEPSEIEDEEERFSSILDDLFGTKMAEEEKRQEDARRTIERAAKLEQESPKGVDIEGVTPMPEGLESRLASEIDQDQQATEKQEATLSEFESTESPEVRREDQQTSDLQSSELRRTAGIEDDMEDEELEFGSVLEDLKESRLEHKPEEDSEDQQLRRPGSLSLEDKFDSVPDSLPQPEAKQVKKDKIVTPTLGEIFAAQGQYAKAIAVFEKLHQKDPDNKAYLRKIEELKRKLEEDSE